jgi:hypothetical protein
MAQVADLHGSSNPKSETLGKADEVLSQLAGSEIDRLLAEAEVAPAEKDAGASDKNDSSTQTSIKPDPRAAAAETELGLDEAALTNQLDELFDKLQQDTAAKTPEPATAAQAQPASPPAAEAPATEGAERAALLEAAGFNADAKPADAPPAQAAAPAASESATAPAPAASETSERDAVLSAAGFENPQSDQESDPIWIKPLVWINAPLTNCSPAVRQAMGRAAIVTMVNALLVLSYLAITHTHHH